MTEVVMPKLGITMTEGEIHEWFVKVGDLIEKGMPILAVESNKAIIEIEAQCSGVLKEILYYEGETVDISTTIALIE